MELRNPRPQPVAPRSSWNPLFCQIGQKSVGLSKDRNIDSGFCRNQRSVCGRWSWVNHAVVLCFAWLIGFFTDSGRGLSHHLLEPEFKCFWSNPKLGKNLKQVAQDSQPHPCRNLRWGLVGLNDSRRYRHQGVIHKGGRRTKLWWRLWEDMGGSWVPSEWAGTTGKLCSGAIKSLCSKFSWRINSLGQQKKIVLFTSNHVVWLKNMGMIPSKFKKAECELIFLTPSIC